MMFKTKDVALDLETRKKIYNLIKNSPGLHFRELQRRLDMGYGALQYHLDFLKRYKLVEEEKVGEYSRYFPSDFKSIIEREFMALLRQKSVRHILLYLLENPGAQNKDIATGTKLSASTVSWHIERLIKAGAVKKESGNEGGVHYYITEPEVVTKLLVTYNSTFFDRVVDRFVELWEKEGLRC